ncbi:MAG: hypothetical protein NT165_02145 [Candidatus Falkowbacteria bacterium]|nr:hypothetical protein [Candidatus Falkowbacteria bacterium]
MINYDKFERSTSYVERMGSTFEKELLGDAPKIKYGEEVYKIKNHLSEEEIEDLSPEKSLALSYEMREYASSCTSSFEKLKESYLTRREAMEAIERCEDGHNPLVFFAATIRKKFADFAQPAFDVEYFTAVGTHLDVMHGIDAYFKVTHAESGLEFIVTIDLSQMDKGNQKADLLWVVTKEQKDLYDHSVTNKAFNKQALEERTDKEINNIIEQLNKKMADGDDRKSFSQKKQEAVSC